MLSSSLWLLVWSHIGWRMPFPALCSRIFLWGMDVKRFYPCIRTFTYYRQAGAFSLNLRVSKSIGNAYLLKVHTPLAAPNLNIRIEWRRPHAYSSTETFKRRSFQEAQTVPRTIITSLISRRPKRRLTKQSVGRKRHGLCDISWDLSFLHGAESHANILHCQQYKQATAPPVTLYVCESPRGH